MIDSEFFNNFDLRIGIVEKHIEDLKHYELKTTLPESLKKDYVFSYDNIKNDIDIFMELKGAAFALKEALGIIFTKIKKNNGIRVDKDYKKITKKIERINDINCKNFLGNINNIRKIIFLRDLRNHLKVSSNIICVVENYKQIVTEVELNGDTISAIENKNIKSYKLIIQIPKFLENYVLFIKEFKKVYCG